MSIAKKCVWAKVSMCTVLFEMRPSASLGNFQKLGNCIPNGLFFGRSTSWATLFLLATEKCFELKRDFMCMFAGERKGGRWTFIDEKLSKIVSSFGIDRNCRSTIQIVGKSVKFLGKIWESTLSHHLTFWIGNSFFSNFFQSTDIIRNAVNVFHILSFPNFINFYTFFNFSFSFQTFFYWTNFHFGGTKRHRKPPKIEIFSVFDFQKHTNSL